MSDPAPSPPVRRRRPSIVFPLILIVFGTVFLLNNLGLLNWDLWTAIARLWPLLIIAIGLDLIISRRSPFSLFLSLVVVLGIVAIALAALFWFDPGREVIRETLVYPLDGASHGVVEVRFAVGELRIGSTADPAALIEGTIDVPEGVALGQREFRRIGDQVQFSLSDYHFGPAVPGPRFPRRWDLRLTREVPLRLRVETGVGASHIDLRDIRATDLEIKTGVGKTELTTPASGVLRAAVEAGIGEVVITIPRAMAARIRVSTGIGRVDVTGDFTREGDVYTSPQFELSADRIELSAKGGIGQLTVLQE